MRKITRMVLISAVLATSGLTAKIATENYKVVATNDERIHKAYELAKKPNKAAVLEAIMDATNAEPDERIRDAVIIEPEEPKVVRVKTKVTTSAGVSPIVPTMDKKTVNKAEEFIEKVAHPAEVVMEIDFPPENIPDTNIPIQELTYEIKDIFPEFEEVAEEAVVMYGWNYPWIITWTKGEQTPTDADGNPLPSPVDHSAIIANMVKYSDAYGLTSGNIINDGVFTYYSNNEENACYNRYNSDLFWPAGTELRTDEYSGSTKVSGATVFYVTKVTYSGVIDNLPTYQVCTTDRSGLVVSATIKETVTLEGNESLGYYGALHTNSQFALHWYFKTWDGN